MAGIRWNTTPETAFTQLSEAYVSAIHRGVLAIAQKWTPQIENWMKANAPWTDRTGNARQALYASVQEVVNQMVTITVAHGVDYGIFLELKNAGRFAIVNPALDEFGVQIWADVKGMLS